MTREQAEKRIEKHLRAIDRIMEQFDPEDKTLHVGIAQDCIMAFNKHWEKPLEKKLDCFWRTGDETDSR